MTASTHPDSRPDDTYVSTTAADGQISSPMIAALEQSWADIRNRHADVPAAVVILGAGSIGAPAGTLRLGHFAATRWNHDTDDVERLAEVFIGGEGLARGPVDVLGTLLHEAAHAIAHVRGVQDTSRQGRWHNARFQALAEEVGITVTRHPKNGWSPTSISLATRDAYAATLAELGQAYGCTAARRPSSVAAGPAITRPRVSAIAGGGSASQQRCSRPDRSPAACVAWTSPSPTEAWCRCLPTSPSRARAGRARAPRVPRRPLNGNDHEKGWRQLSTAAGVGHCR